MNNLKELKVGEIYSVKQLKDFFGTTKDTFIIDNTDMAIINTKNYFNSTDNDEDLFKVTNMFLSFWGNSSGSEYYTIPTQKAHYYVLKYYML